MPRRGVWHLNKIPFSECPLLKKRAFSGWFILTIYADQMKEVFTTRT